MTNEHKFDHGQSTSLQLAKQYMGKEVTVTIDRPIGSKHPKHGTIYPINYGYLEGVQAPDGEDLDAYVLGVDGPCSTFTGHCVAIIHRHNDDDDKLVVAPEGCVLTSNEIAEATQFQEQWFDSEIIIV